MPHSEADAGDDEQRWQSALHQLSGLHLQHESARERKEQRISRRGQNRGRFTQVAPAVHARSQQQHTLVAVRHGPLGKWNSILRLREQIADAVASCLADVEATPTQEEAILDLVVVTPPVLRRGQTPPEHDTSDSCARHASLRPEPLADLNDESFAKKDTQDR